MVMFKPKRKRKERERTNGQVEIFCFLNLKKKKLSKPHIGKYEAKNMCGISNVLESSILKQCKGIYRGGGAWNWLPFLVGCQEFLDR